MASFGQHFGRSMKRAKDGFLRGIFPIYDNDLIAAPAAIGGMAGGIGAAYLTVAAVAASPLMVGAGLLCLGLGAAALSTTGLRERLGGPVEAFCRGVLTPVYVGAGLGLATCGGAAMAIYSAISFPISMVVGALRAPLDWALDKTGVKKFIPEKKMKYYRPAPTPVSDLLRNTVDEVGALVEAFNAKPVMAQAREISPKNDRKPR